MIRSKLKAMAHAYSNKLNYKEPYLALCQPTSSVLISFSSLLFM